jgi:SAM-dependent methyltransferase
MEYTQAYENSLYFSPCFQSYAESLAARLIERHNLHDKDIIEIGSGKGEFLTLLCELGDNRGVGFDPSYVPDPEANATTERITFVQDFYSELYASYKADLICCRHVLEHIHPPRDFLSSVRHSIGNRTTTVVFFEVPNVLFTLRDLGIWDLIYEHYSYFSANSLRRLFTLCGFDVSDLTEAYAGQFLCIEALPGENSTDSPHSSTDDLGEMTARVVAFADEYRNKVETWERHIKQMTQLGQRAVVWGGGSKGVTFLNMLKIQAQIKYVIDINPRKQGMYVAGTGQQIMAPEFVQDYQPEVVIVMNPIYESEIRQLVKHLDLTPEFMIV